MFLIFKFKKTKWNYNTCSPKRYVQSHVASGLDTSWFIQYINLTFALTKNLYFSLFLPIFLPWLPCKGVRLFFFFFSITLSVLLKWVLNKTKQSSPKGVILPSLKPCWFLSMFVVGSKYIRSQWTNWHQRLNLMLILCWV